METRDIQAILISHAFKISFSGANLANAITKIFEAYEQEKRKEDNEKRKDD